MREHLEAFHLRHVQIDKSYVGMVLFAQIQGLVTVFGLIHRVAHGLEDQGEVFQDVAFVVGNEKYGPWVTP